jgi:hypothetical protein
MRPRDTRYVISELPTTDKSAWRTVPKKITEPGEINPVSEQVTVWTTVGSIPDKGKRYFLFFTAFYPMHTADCFPRFTTHLHLMQRC